MKDFEVTKQVVIDLAKSLMKVELVTYNAFPNDDEAARMARECILHSSHQKNYATTDAELQGQCSQATASQ
jgi:hypothetical protein